MFSQTKAFGFSTKSSRRLWAHRTVGQRVPSKRLLTGLLFVFCVCILAAVAAAYMMVREDNALFTGRHVVFFIDLTDGLTDEQYDSFRQEFEYRKNSLRVGDRLSIYAIKGCDDRQGPGKGVKLFSNWRLPDGSQANFVTSNPKILKKRFIEQFEMPLQDALESINPEQTADTSPILETLLSMARSSEFAEATQREVVIFSNLMQNSGALSLYNPYCSFEKLQNRSLWILDVQSLFAGAEIRVYLIPDEKYPQRQQETLTKFWVIIFHMAREVLKSSFYNFHFSGVTMIMNSFVQNQRNLVSLKCICLCLLLISNVFVNNSPAYAQSDFLDYVNKDSFKRYKSGLFLGMFNSRKEAEQFLGEQTLNPVTLEPYDVVFAFGISGSKPWVKAWETGRVIGDNLSWSPLTNYSKIEGLKFDYLVAHSNGNDIASNAIKTGLIKVDNFISLAAPAGFRKEAQSLHGVQSVEIYRTSGDPVAEVLGKKTVFGVFQKLGDLNIGVLNKISEPMIGFEISRPWPDEIQQPKLTERVFSGPYYFTNNLHRYETNANNVVLDKMYSLQRTAKTTSPQMTYKLSEVREQFNKYHARFSKSAEKFDQTIGQFPAGPTLQYTPKLDTKTINAVPLINNMQDDFIVTHKDAADHLLVTALSLEASLNFLNKNSPRATLDNVKILKKLCKAINNDIEMAGEGGYALVKSYTLEQIGKYGLKKMPNVIERLQKRGELSKSFSVPDMSWAGDIFQAIGNVETTGNSKFVFLKSHTLEQIGKTGIKQLPSMIKWLKKNGELSESFSAPNLSWAGDLFQAIGKDVETTGNSRFVLLRSHTLEQVGKIGIEQMPVVVSALKASGKLPSSFHLPATFGAVDFAVAIGRSIGSGRADIDTITHYLDGFNQAAWGIVGFMTGGAEGAQLYQSMADSGAKLTREVTQPLFNKMVLGFRGQGKKLVDDWQTLQTRRIHDGLSIQTISEVYGEDLLLQNGFKRAMIRELDTEIYGVNRKLVNMKRDFGVQKIETYTNTGGVELGGVCICPHLTYAGKGGAALKREALESRGSENDLSWDIEIAGEVQ